MNESIPPPEGRALKQHVVVVMPCYNVGDRIRKTLESLLALVDRVIVVDDGSTDGSTEGLEQRSIIKIVFQENRGKGHALVEGIRHALTLPDVAAVALMDADGQHAPADLPDLYREFQTNNADFAIGARRLDKSLTPWRSRFGNQVTAWLAARLFHCPFADTQCGYRLLSPRFAAEFVDTVPGGRYETEMLMIIHAIRGDYKLLSAPVTTIYEPGNPSSHFRKIQDSLRIYAALWRALRQRG